jgi:hypothetical protein
MKTSLPVHVGLVVPLLVMLQLLPCSLSFSPQQTLKPSQHPQERHHHSSVLFVGGGKGWDNGNYLEGLGGSKEDRDEAHQDYQEFKESREAFLERQKALMDTEQGRKFLEDRARMQQRQQQQQAADDDWGAPQPAATNKAGGSRFQHLMQQSKKMQQQMGQQAPDFDFEQKLAPMDEDEEE